VVWRFYSSSRPYYAQVLWNAASTMPPITLVRHGMRMPLGLICREHCEGGILQEESQQMPPASSSSTGPIHAASTSNSSLLTVLS
jgi:hypothetical protein